MNRILSAVLAITIVVMCYPDTMPAADEFQKCVKMKRTAARKYQKAAATCVLKYYTGKELDLTACRLEAQAKLETTWLKAELVGNCTDDGGTGIQVTGSNNAATVSALALGLQNTSSEVAHNCAIAKFKALYKYLGTALKCNVNELREDPPLCVGPALDKLALAFQKFEVKSDGMCHTVNDHATRADVACAILEEPWTDLGISHYCNPDDF